MKEWVIVNIINKKIKLNSLKEKVFIENYGEELFRNIKNETIFLADNCKLTERIYCILNDIKEVPKCKVCRKEVSFIKFGKGYKKYCNGFCREKDPEVLIKRKLTWIKNYGVDNPSKSNNIKIKKKKPLTKIME